MPTNIQVKRETLVVKLINIFLRDVLVIEALWGWGSQLRWSGG